MQLDTRNPQVLTAVGKNKPANTEILGGLSAKLMWGLVEERKKKEEDIQKSLSEQKALYHMEICLPALLKRATG